MFPGVGLALFLLCGLFCGAICFVSCLVFFVLVFFGPFGVAVASPGWGGGRGGWRGRVWKGGGGAGLSAFRTFVRLVPVWFCLFPLPVGVWEGLRFVIVALPGLFSYLFFLLCQYDNKQREPSHLPGSQSI